MEAGKGRSGWRAGLVGAVLALTAGCAVHRSRLEEALMAQRAPRALESSPALAYHLLCPDVVEINVAGAPAWSGRHRVGADGKIDLAEAGRVRVEGLTPPQVAATVAELACVDPGVVAVNVVEYSSQQVFLFGEVTGQQRALPYQGPETVLELLRRAGGLTPGAAPSEVAIVRPHIADAKAPEVFHVDLEAILLKKDQHSNVRLEPFDQVYIGQSSPSKLRPCVPPWLRPTYEALCGMRRRGSAGQLAQGAAPAH